MSVTERVRLCGIDLLETLLSTTMSTKETLCRRLDALVLDFFSKLSELDGKKAELESMMAEGFIQLSKTRYNLGSGVGNSIGAVMYDRSHMTATVKVVSEEEIMGEDVKVNGVIEIEEGDDDDEGGTKFRLTSTVNLSSCSSSPSKTISTKSSNNARILEDEPAEGRIGKNTDQKENGERDDIIENCGPLLSSDGLRQRKGGKNCHEGEATSKYSSTSSSTPAAASKAAAAATTEKVDDAIENLGKAVCDLTVSPDGMMELQTMKSPSSNTGSPSPSRSSASTGGSSSPTAASNNDPIRWFGILVPQSLRMSQRRFKSSLDLVVEIANLQLEIGRLQTRFKKLVTRKNALTIVPRGSLKDDSVRPEEIDDEEDTEKTADNDVVALNKSSPVNDSVIQDAVTTDHPLKFIEEDEQ